MRPVLSAWLWRLECHLNRSLPRPWAAHAPAVFERLGNSVAVFERAPGDVLPQCDLCVVLTTHRRAKACLESIESIATAAAELPELRVFVLVLEDKSDADYASVLQGLEQRFSGRYAFYRSQQWLGKRGYWRVYERAFVATRQLNPELTLFLQDDLAFQPTFLSHLLDLWRELQDPRKAVLNAFAMPNESPRGRWTHYQRQDCESAALWKTQWFDLPAFLVGSRFFEVLRGRVFPVPGDRWSRDPTCSSGVGEQLTRRLFKRANIYQVKTSLVHHGTEISLMNPEGRQRIPFDNRVCHATQSPATIDRDTP
jgi:hypothetical protein